MLAMGVIQSPQAINRDIVANSLLSVVIFRLHRNWTCSLAELVVCSNLMLDILQYSACLYYRMFLSSLPHVRNSHSSTAGSIYPTDIPAEGCLEGAMHCQPCSKSRWTNRWTLWPEERPHEPQPRLQVITYNEEQFAWSLPF